MARFIGCWEYPSKMISYSPAGSGLANRMNSIYACHRSSEEVHVYWERGNKAIFDYGSPKFYFPDVIETIGNSYYMLVFRFHNAQCSIQNRYPQIAQYELTIWSRYIF